MYHIYDLAMGVYATNKHLMTYILNYLIVHCIFSLNVHFFRNYTKSNNIID